MDLKAKFLHSEDIYNCIKDDIINLRLAPGSFVSENELARKYNVSRTPVKSAFLRLMTEKFIEIVPQRGTYVTRMDINHIRDIIYMRTILEREIFCSVMDNPSNDLIEKLYGILADQAALVSHNGGVDSKDYYKLDSAFHGALFEYAQHTHLWELIQESQVYYTRFRMLDIIATRSHAQLTREHEEILKAFIDKDGERLKTLLYEHLHGNLNRLSSSISTEFAEYFVL